MRNYYVHKKPRETMKLLTLQVLATVRKTPNTALLLLLEKAEIER